MVLCGEFPAPNVETCAWTPGLELLRRLRPPRVPQHYHTRVDGGPVSAEPRFVAAAAAAPAGAAMVGWLYVYARQRNRDSRVLACALACAVVVPLPAAAAAPAPEELGGGTDGMSRMLLARL